MSLLRISNFGGIAPRMARRTLPESASVYAFNAKLTSGELRPWWALKEIATVSINGAKTLYRYLYNNASRVLAFSQFTEVVEAALVNDAFDRIYYTNASGVFITTKADIENVIAPRRLGVPTPAFATFTAGQSGGTPSGPAETRVYTAILVSAYGEEGSTGPTATVSGPIDATFTVTGLNTLTYDNVVYNNITKVRLYRTITSAAGVDYRQVAEWNIGTQPSPYTDTVTATDLSDNPALQSLEWTPPPVGLRGLIALSGGFNAAFKGNEIWFTPPYYPHAWPESYKLAVEDNIVGLGAFGNTLVVATTGRPAVISGSSPDAMSLDVVKRPFPCLSMQSIVSTGVSVVYASPEGLIEFGPNGMENKTELFITKDEWALSFPMYGLMAAMYQTRYIGFYTTILGITFGMDDPNTAFTQLESEGVTAVNQDNVTGGVLLAIGNKVYEWDTNYATSLTYLWRSKPHMRPKPENFGAIQLRGDFLASPETMNVSQRAPLTGHELNASMINGVSNLWGYSINGPGGGAFSADTRNVAVKVYGDSILRWEGVISNELPVRLPSGYKAHEFEIELEGAMPVYSATLAGTIKELERVP